MNYGAMIRNAREELSLYLRDLSQENLSFNLLSNIEKGKTKLTKQKALMLYKTILKYSWEKKIFPEINFDLILEDNAEYLVLKRAHEYCSELLIRFNSDEEMSIEQYDLAKDLAIVKEVNFFSYYIYYLSANLLPSNKLNEKYEAYCKALDYLYWSDISENIYKFKSCLEESITIAYKLSNHKTLVKYYELLLDAQKKYSYRIDSTIYYNLALFNNILGESNIALKYLNKYIDYNIDCSFVDDLDSMILKASILGKLSNFDEAIKLNIKILDKLRGNGLEYQESICLSNNIYWCTLIDSDDCKIMISNNIKRLQEIFEIIADKRKSNDGLYLNIGLGYSSLGNLSGASEYIKKALDTVPNDKRRVVVLEDAFDVLIKLEEFETLLKVFEDIAVKDLEEKELIKYLKLLLKLRNIVDEVMLDKALKQQFFRLIEKI